MPSTLKTRSPRSSSASSCVSPKHNKFYVGTFVGWIAGALSVLTFYRAVEIREAFLNNAIPLVNREMWGGNQTKSITTSTTSLLSATLNSTLYPTQPATVATTGDSDPNHKKHAILVPYRRRDLHLRVFKEFMAEYLPQNYPNASFSIWVIEQDDAEPFNRAWLGNVGFTEITKQIPDVECITFHDVDLIPDTNTTNVEGPVWYDHCDFPVLTGSQLSHHLNRRGEWAIPYAGYAGGITTMHQTHWRQINGYSNDYVGWGGEDDDLNCRLKQNGLHFGNTGRIQRPPKGFGRFQTINQSSEHHIADKDKQNSTSYQITLKILRLMRRGSKRYKLDGLSDLVYTAASHQQETIHAQSGLVVHHIKAQQQLLEFVHVPKTAGSAIEKAAGKAGIPWGACHWLNPGLHCPKPPNFEGLGVTCASHACKQHMWLVPSYTWNIDMMVGKKTFCVVRNPYDRVVSLFYDKELGYKRATNDTRILNEFVRDKLESSTEYKWTELQSTFVYNRQNQVIHHVLKYENLRAEFSELMHQYNLTQITLDGKDGGNKEEEGFQFQVSDFDDSTLAMIEQRYGPDFDHFGYKRILG